MGHEWLSSRLVAGSLVDFDHKGPCVGGQAHVGIADRRTQDPSSSRYDDWHSCGSQTCDLEQKTSCQMKAAARMYFEGMWQSLEARYFWFMTSQAATTPMQVRRKQFVAITATINPTLLFRVSRTDSCVFTG